MKHGIVFFGMALLVALTLSSVLTGFGQWSHDPNVNNAISTAPSIQVSPAMTTDGAGGAIVVWADFRNGNYDIFAKRISSAGTLPWGPGDVPICTAPSPQNFPTIVSDNSGGAIIAWEDWRGGTSDIYAQRINSTGVALWTNNGIPIDTSIQNQERPLAVSDGSGGAVIAWTDSRNGTMDVYAQRVDGAGAKKWNSIGVALVTEGVGDQGIGAITSDGKGGAVVSWHDFRNANADVYVQRIDSSGATKWTTDGVALATNLTDEYSGKILSDGTGGAFVTWADYSFGYSDVYVQRIEGTGTIDWTPGGVPLSTDAYFQYGTELVSDGVGGCIITWSDGRSGFYDVYAQRLNAYGVNQWTAGGIPVNALAQEQIDPKIISDNAGGAIISWKDYRNGTADAYAQHIDGSGSARWLPEGIPISTAPGDQYNFAIIGEGTGGAILSWQDQRAGGIDIFAQNIDRYGALGDASPQIVQVKDVINDQGGRVSLMWKPSYMEEAEAYQMVVTFYTLYRGLKPSAVPSTAHAFEPEAYEKLSPDVRAKSYLKLPLSASGTDTIYWENIASVNSEHLGGYSYTVETLSDSGPQGIPQTYFMVRARSYSGADWRSNVDSGYSTDNLPPGAAQSLSASAFPGPLVKLHWPENVDDPDVGYYETHRSIVADFIPDPGTRIGQATDTSFTDLSPVNGVTNYYKVVTVDVHGNRSLPSPQASTTITGVEDKGDVTPTEFSLYQNYPNPFNPATEIRYNLPAGVGQSFLTVYPVSLRVYDMLGHLVVTLVDGEQSAGFKSVKWDAGGLPSGMYYYRLVAGEYREMKSMLLIK